MRNDDPLKVAITRVLKITKSNDPSKVILIDGFVLDAIISESCFLFLSYVGSLLVGTIFVVTGFASTDFEMSAVGVVLVIAGACLAVVCDLLRRFGCGWTKVATEAANSGRIIQSDSDFTLSIPYLPGYPGFNTAVDDRRPDNPPPYDISESYESAK